MISHTPFCRLLCLFALLLLGFLPAQSEAALNSQEQAIADLMTNASNQGRPFLKIDPILSQVARAKAADMARRGYFDHTNPDGHGPNYLVRQAGYDLPPIYSTSPSANNIESIAAGRDSASATWGDWMNSSSHKRHLLAESSFYAEQTSVGIGYVYDGGSKYRSYWVILTAPPSAAVQIEVKTPVSGARVNNSQVTVTGTTSGATPVQAVQVRVENAAGTTPFRPASGTGNWSASVAGLVPGPNTIRVQALDAGGKLLAQATRKVQYFVSEELVVTVSGNGSVSNGFLGTSGRALGSKYTVEATPAAGWLFTGWSAGVTSSQPKLTFTMKPGLELVATFIPNPFAERQGLYTGLLLQNDERNAATTGRLQLKVNKAGAFTGYIVMGGKRYGIKGKFDTAGEARVKLGRSGGTAELLLDVAGMDGLSATVRNGGAVATATGTLGLPKGTAGYANAGRYAVAIPRNPEETNAQVPVGDGYGTLVVTSQGAARLTGSLPDGSPFSVSGSFDAAGGMTIYAPLYAGRGVLAGQLQFGETEVSDLDGQVLWVKPATTGVHPHAFATDAPVVACRYVAPGTGETVLDVAAGENNVALSLGAGDLEEPVTQSLTLEATNRVRLSAPELEKLSVKVNALTGTYSGSFVHPATGAATRIGGVIFQKQNAGFGYFLGKETSGYSSLTPGVERRLVAAPEVLD